MGRLYDFGRLVRKYAAVCGPVVLVRREGGGYDAAGVFVPGAATRQELVGAAVAAPTERRVYEPGGAMTAADRELYCAVPIEAPLEGARIEYGGKSYGIEECRDYAEYADVAVYLLKWVENLGDAAGEEDVDDSGG